MPPVPDLNARLAARRRPDRALAGYQRWNHLLFLHWDCDPALVQATLPRGLHVDTHDGRAWIGVVPFFMQRIRPRFVPPVPGISWFLELNVRTYVCDDRGRPGVWFYSLDCNQPLAVAIARRFFHLPYHHAKMRAAHDGKQIDYQCQRKGADAAAHYRWKPGLAGYEAMPGSLEFFLVERYLLFASDPNGRLFSGQVHHAPYRIAAAEVSALSRLPMLQAGFALEGAPKSILSAEAVDVEIFRIQPVQT